LAIGVVPVIPYIVTESVVVVEPFIFVSVNSTLPVPAPPPGHVTVMELKPFVVMVGVPEVAVIFQLKVTPVVMDDV
jgi:hypothetical protein